MAKTVLVVHEEQHCRRLVEVNMQRLGYKVLLASDASEATHVVRGERPDLVIASWWSLPKVLAEQKANANMGFASVMVMGPDGTLQTLR